ncbi:MAG: transferase [Verrucomicrobiaceae bacterium]|nr:MAG: transferase [Verrucomicrobiaceae bacterium]
MVARQLGSLFIFRADTESGLLSEALVEAVEACDHCFSRTVNKYYHRDGETFFNPFHSGQYSIFLYFLSRGIAARQPEGGTLADRVYFLNKALNGLDLFHGVRMPRVFFLDHPVGSVIGRAEIGDGFSFSQNCTVGNNKGIFPTLGRNVSMMSGSKILGRCRIGDDVTLAANSYVKDTDIPGGSIVFGSSPNLVIKAARPSPD